MIFLQALQSAMIFIYGLELKSYDYTETEKGSKNKY